MSHEQPHLKYLTRPFTAVCLSLSRGAGLQQFVYSICNMDANDHFADHRDVQMPDIAATQAPRRSCAPMVDGVGVLEKSHWNSGLEFWNI